MGVYKNLILSRTPRSYYPFDDASTASAVDLALGNNGTYVTGTYVNQAGFVIDSNTTLNCMSNDNSQAQGRVSIPAAAIPPAGSPGITVEFWARKTGAALGGNSMIEVLSTSGFRMLNIHLIWSDGNIYWDCGPGVASSGDYDRISKAYDFDPAVWHHYAFTKNISAGSMSIFVDGILWHYVGTGNTKAIGTAQTAAITNYATAGSTAFIGTVSNFAMYPRELSAKEIQQNYMEGRTTRSGRTVTVTYPYMKRPGAFRVPSGVSKVRAVCSGASGGAGNGGRQGYGLTVTADMPVIGDEVWRIQPGKRGTDQQSAGTQAIGGWPNGGNGGQQGGNVNGASGGGYSRIYRDSDSVTAIIAAGGGGAGSHSWNGGESGDGGDAAWPNGGNGVRGKNLVNGDMGYVGQPGSGATQSAHGAGGAGTAYGGTGAPYAGNAGNDSFGGGGGGNNYSSYGGSGGGGGGGYFSGGGGGGGNTYGGGSGGGAGSSYVGNGTTYVSSASRDGDGLITMSYDMPYSIPTMMP